MTKKYDEDEDFLARHRVFCSNLPRDATENALREILEQGVGPVTKLFVLIDRAGHSRQCAFADFLNETDARRACGELSGRVLMDGRALRFNPDRRFFDRFANPYYKPPKPG